MKAILIILILGILALSGCVTVSMQVPEGFALQNKTFDNMKAISPEGLRLELRRALNSPEKDLTFWQDAYLYQMIESGYQLFSETERFTSKSGPGFYTEWAVPYLGETWIYLNAVIIKGKDIVILEAAGPLSIYTDYKENIITALSTIE